MMETSNRMRKIAQRSRSHADYKGARWMGSGVVPPTKGHLRSKIAPKKRKKK